MRPVEKLEPGSFVTYRDSSDEEVRHKILEDYSTYGKAKAPLAANIGQYCSYCECECDLAKLEVEHIEPKGDGGSETAWGNFLLGCKTCNTVKPKKISGKTYHLPHQNNTFMDFVYDRTGRIAVNSDIPKVSQINAQNLLDLLGLQRYPSEDKPSKCDFRWKKRVEAWNTATIQLKAYTQGIFDEDDIISVAKVVGHWSIWFTVFKDQDSVLERLISDFEGTCTRCFDSSNHYVPIYRNPMNAEDPV